MPQHWRQRAGPGRAYPRNYSPMPWTRNPMDWLDPQTFSFHFRNLQFANGRNLSYLCYQVEREENRSLILFAKGVFRNQVYPETPCHAELCFLSWLDNKLSCNEYYHVTWFISWSPCFNCARRVTEFLETHRNVELSIFTARLYYFWHPKYQQGLRSLDSRGVEVAIMSFWDFKYCWENFVYNGGRDFKPWKKIHKNHYLMVTSLEEILG